MQLPNRAASKAKAVIVPVPEAAETDPAVAAEMATEAAAEAPGDIPLKWSLSQIAEV